MKKQQPVFQDSVDTLVTHPASDQPLRKFFLMKCRCMSMGWTEPQSILAKFRGQARLLLLQNCRMISDVWVFAKYWMLQPHPGLLTMTHWTVHRRSPQWYQPRLTPSGPFDLRSSPATCIKPAAGSTGQDLINHAVGVSQTIVNVTLITLVWLNWITLAHWPATITYILTASNL